MARATDIEGGAAAVMPPFYDKKEELRFPFTNGRHVMMVRSRTWNTFENVALLDLVSAVSINQSKEVQDFSSPSRLVLARPLDILNSLVAEL